MSVPSLGPARRDRLSSKRLKASLNFLQVDSATGPCSPAVALPPSCSSAPCRTSCRGALPVGRRSQGTCGGVAGARAPRSAPARSLAPSTGPVRAQPRPAMPRHSAARRRKGGRHAHPGANPPGEARPRTPALRRSAPLEVLLAARAAGLRRAALERPDAPAGGRARCPLRARAHAPASLLRMFWPPGELTAAEALSEADGTAEGDLVAGASRSAIACAPPARATSSRPPARHARPSSRRRLRRAAPPRRTSAGEHTPGQDAEAVRNHQRGRKRVHAGGWTLDGLHACAYFPRPPPPSTRRRRRSWSSSAASPARAGRNRS